MNTTHSRLKTISVKSGSAFNKVFNDIQRRGNYPEVKISDGTKFKGNINSLDRSKVKIGRKLLNLADITSVDEKTRNNDTIIMRYKATGSVKQDIRQIVATTIREEGADLSYASRVVTSLISAGVPQKVSRESNIQKIQAFTRSKIKKYVKTPSPLKAIASTSNVIPTCPYCRQPMSIVGIAGDLIKKVLFCKQDRISLPLISENQ